ncbi:MAG: flagellar M-ring protein FliF C-terminal domain-containing protein [Phycisphaerales bacterium]
MGRLGEALTTIQRSLVSLSLSQRLLIALAAVVIIMTLLLVSVWAVRPTMVELAGFSPDRLREAQPLLDSMGIANEVRGGKLMVPSEKYQSALGVLAQNGKLPDDTTVLFSNLAAKQHWMNSRSENDRQFNIALQNELAQVVRNFKGVRAATVMIDAPEPVGFGMAFRKPTASVTVQTDASRPLDAAMVDAVAGLVAGAKAGLAATDVRVIDATTRRQFRARGEEGFGATDYLEHAAKVENRVQEKINAALAYIPGVIVAVNAQVDVRKSTMSETSMLPVTPEGGSVAIVSDEITTNSGTQSGGSGGVPGLQSNVTEDINRGVGGAGGGAAPRTTDEKTDTKFKVEVGRRTKQVVDPRGMPTKVNVTINVPREYVAALARAGQGEKGAEQAEVPQAEIDRVFVAEKERITGDIAPLVETMAAEGAVGAGGAAAVTQAGVVTVSMMPLGLNLAGGVGGAAAGLLGGGGGAGGLGGVAAMLGDGMVKQIALGALAVVALGMMLMLVKKSGAPISLPTPQELVGVPPTLEAQSDLVGEADETQTAMLGIELGDDQLKSKKMLEQVAEMVKKNPADAAGLMNRWIQTEG